MGLATKRLSTRARKKTHFYEPEAAATTGASCKKTGRARPAKKSRRSGSAVEQVYPKKGWSAAEDQQLSSLVATHQKTRTTVGWAKIGRAMGSRSGKQCRERYSNHLSPDLKKTDWTDDELAKLRKLHAELGNQWAKISTKIKGRSANDVKNRYNVIKKSEKGKMNRRTTSSKKATTKLIIATTSAMPKETPPKMKETTRVVNIRPDSVQEAMPNEGKEAPTISDPATAIEKVSPTPSVFAELGLPSTSTTSRSNSIFKINGGPKSSNTAYAGEHTRHLYAPIESIATPSELFGGSGVIAALLNSLSPNVPSSQDMKSLKSPESPSPLARWPGVAAESTERATIIAGASSATTPSGIGAVTTASPQQEPMHLHHPCLPFSEPIMPHLLPDPSYGQQLYQPSPIVSFSTSRYDDSIVFGD